MRNKTITRVEPDSPAAREGLQAGDRLLSINGEPVVDLIDYEALTVPSRLAVEVEREGQKLRYLVRKRMGQGLGLCFETTLMDRMQTCKNRCVFCFVDQMPKGIRSSLNVKDDDWRLSFIMGNYVTLTNVSDEEFTRILRRRVSPLYVSVHATDPALRVKLMGNPTAGRIMERLMALQEAGITFHTQLVLCPGLNDGPVLEKTLADLSGLYPYCASVAAVPVGLTKFREGLFPLRGYTKEEAQRVIDLAEARQREYLSAWGDPLLYLSDEWYLMGQRPLPAYESYGDFPQLENGVGMLRLLERECEEALEERTPLPAPRHITVAGGMAAHPFVKQMVKGWEAYGLFVDTVPVENRFFGGNVHVAGLVTGSDLLAAFPPGQGEPLLIPRNMLRAREDVFLDGMTVSQVEQALGRRLVPFADGRALIEIMMGETL